MEPTTTQYCYHGHTNGVLWTRWNDHGGMPRGTNDAWREPAPKLASEHWHKYETGDCVSHAQYGPGVVIRLEWSSALRSILYHVRYESGEIHAALAGDLQPREEQAR